MSIASEITRLQNIKTAIRNALVNKGVTSAATHDMADFATDIGSIPSGGTYQSKTVSPTTSSQTVSPDSGYDALSSVTVNAIQTQTKSSSNLLAGGSVTLTPDTGKYLTSATVSAASLSSQTSATATASKILSGYTAWVNGSRLTGSYIPMMTFNFAAGQASWEEYDLDIDNNIVIFAAYRTSSSEPQFLLVYDSNNSNMRYGAIYLSGTWYDYNYSSFIQPSNYGCWMQNPDDRYAWTIYAALIPRS